MSNIKTSKNTATAGFTLVELSIVIIIIGFLIAGISAGTSLIKQAKLNSLISDFQNYQVAFNSFKGRFNTIPGDMENAGSYWPGVSCAETTANCNGDGDGVIEFMNIPTTAGEEVIKAWKHLSLAGLINFSAPQLPDTFVVISVGNSAPKSSIEGAGYMIVGGDTAGGTFIASDSVSHSPWGSDRTNAIYLGKPYANALDLASLKPEETFLIDQKIDDGAVNGSDATGAITGKCRSLPIAPSSLNSSVCHTTGVYSITNPETACVTGVALE